MWWSDDEWAALADQRHCGMCADMHLEENDHSLLVASTATSHMRIARNQAHPGYSLVILREHITDLVELEPEQLSAFWSDVQRAGRAITAIFEPRKIDYLVMGHRMPHLHCHVFPQHANDGPRRNVDISDGPDLIPLASLREHARELRSVWENLDASR
ncbi:HIT family protein [Microbacterium sp. SD291]|uniref:HIT family protein n=1 Tax=Microbacterium sp. SD291 TaxID=2782007 RepID=UPI001A978F32|nr:HIT family protein [Microbacterium sp. SD291]MBO0980626.1 HIT family protein [Microbacterium sp. SD291]